MRGEPNAGAGFTLNADRMQRSITISQQIMAPKKQQVAPDSQPDVLPEAEVNEIINNYSGEIRKVVEVW